MEKQIERLLRDNNLLKLENKALIKKNADFEKTLSYFKKRDAVLETLETYLKINIDKHKNSPCKPLYYTFFLELKNALDYERDKIDEEEYV